MPQALLAVDICNTIADVNSEIKKVFGANPNPLCYLHPGVPLNFFKYNTWIFKDVMPFKGAADILNQLANIYTIIYITARPKEAELVTLEWIEKNGFPKGEILFSTQKHETAKHLNVMAAIEDAPHEIDSYLAAEIPVFVKRQPYNLNYQNVFDWADEKIKSFLLREALCYSERSDNIYGPQTNLLKHI